MRQIILTVAILMLTVTVSAQQKDENKILDSGQKNLLSASVKDESNVSAVALDLNNQAVKKTLNEQDYAGSTELFRKAVENDLRCLVCYYNLGLSLINLEKYDESTKMFTKAISLKSDHAYAYAGLGEAFAKKGLYN